MNRIIDDKTGQWRNFEHLEVAWQNGPTYQVKNVPVAIRVFGEKEHRTVSFQYATDPARARKDLGIEVYGFWIALGFMGAKLTSWLSGLM